MDSFGILKHLQFYLIGGAICTALVSLVYFPMMRQASNSQKGLVSTLIFTACALILYAFWGYSPSYNSGIFGVVAPALFAIFTVGWIGCTAIDLIRTLLKSRPKTK
jgi:hypothetical protein